MVDRIEKVTKVKGVSYDIGRPFERKEGYEDENQQGGSFYQMLKHNMKKSSDGKVTISEPYKLELSRATQSLFYEKGLQIKALERKLHDKG